MMDRIGIFYHPAKPTALALAEEMSHMLRRQGCQTWSASLWDETIVATQVADLDLILALSGDGGLLQAARLGACHGVPILGIKLGRSNSLGEVLLDDWQESLLQVLAGEYWLEEHMMLRVAVWRGEEILGQAQEALDDVVISRGNLARVVRVIAYVDGYRTATYRADGIIVATATGSTSYALAVGGPVLMPEMKDILLIPVAPYRTFDRTVILPQEASIELQVFPDDQAVLTVDGQLQAELESGDVIRVVANPYSARLVRLQDRAYFYRTLMERVQWEMWERRPFFDISETPLPEYSAR